VEVKYLSEFESILDDPETEWIKLKIFDDHDIAVGIYRNRRSITGRIYVSVYRFSKIELLGGELQTTEVMELPGISQSFKKHDLKIARWYYKQLCKSFKNGIIVWDGARKSSFGRWD